MGWATLMNGVLLRAAEIAGFELMVTCDQNIFYQQNLKGRTLSLVVLTTNNWKAIRGRTGDVLAAVNASRAGSFLVVKI